ncbi:MAG TPA: hypothetical protein VH247_02855 [Thermoleophilaceae bacterium]|nr:hypothetical protein [Thermoleophilaceae bacterium]
MSDFLGDLRNELEAAARRRAHSHAGRASRRTVAIAVAAALAVIAVPAAAVTGVFRSSPGGSSQPGLVDVAPPCVDNRKPQLQTTSAPPPQELTRLLGVLRRPQQAGDKFPDPDSLAMLPIAGVNLDAIRLVRAAKPSIYLVPAGNVRYFRPPPDTPGCEGMQRPALKPLPGVCLVEHHSAASCTPVEGIRNGKNLLTSGSRHDLTEAAAIAPDGVESIIWRVRRGTGFLDTKVPVRDNLYAGRFPSRAGHGLYVYWVMADGRRKLVIGPHKFTKRELAMLRRERARDLAAGPKPSVFPRSGTAKTIFTLRMRIAKPDRRTVYVASWQAPPTSACASYLHNRIGMMPATRGELKGLMKSGFGPPAPTNWCPGAYAGIVQKQKGGRVVGHFSFTVR